MQRGLVCYEYCSNAELEKFVADRGIDLVPSEFIDKKTHGMSRHKLRNVDLIATLKEADDTATFNRFADLPPELRSRIYKMYFEVLELALCPAQPPITKVSR